MHAPSQGWGCAGERSKRTLLYVIPEALGGPSMQNVAMSGSVTGFQLEVLLWVLGSSCVSLL
jgi:hypothetical protein